MAASSSCKSPFTCKACLGGVLGASTDLIGFNVDGSREAGATPTDSEPGAIVVEDVSAASTGLML